MSERGTTGVVARGGRWDRTLQMVEHHGNRLLRPIGTWAYRCTGGRIAPAGRDVVLLTTRGRRTGREHTVLVQAFRDGEDIILVAANAGKGTLPDWFLNLEAAGSAVVENRGHRVTLRPEIIPPDSAATFWPRILEVAPTYARYRRASGRNLPLVRLKAVEDGGPGR